ncbi:protein C10-like [Saccoglossus kowalevskii]|uniref:Protein C10 n=1 Tax=Saccoglossus kowalevskii TaxID=10224 RepID=A0ABM0MVL6_SACKO|nr:PREDICTED: protein C10-like [Saccoglossus kowalevskii]
MALSHQPNLSQEQVRSLLKDVIAAFDSPENMIRMDEAHDNAGNDMMKMMQIVFPVATQIQQEVIQKYGFTPDGDGAIKFAQSIRQYENLDSEISQMGAKLKSMFLPPMPQMTSFSAVDASSTTSLSQQPLVAIPPLSERARSADV